MLSYASPIVLAAKSKTRRMLLAAQSYVTTLWDRREFAWYMAMGNLRSRNATTALGLLWWVLNPILMGMVYFVVFGLILDISRDLAYLLSGIFVFYYTTTSMTTGANSIIQNRAILVNLHFPRLILPITAVIEAGVGFLVSIPALYLIIGPIEGIWPPRRFLILFPIIFVIQTVFNLGLAAMTARITVPFRDINNVIPHLLRIWFYLSPILYTAGQFGSLPSWAVKLYNLNPLVPILSVYRSALLGYKLETADLIFAAIWAFGFAAIAITVFVKYEGKMARYL
jgi:teichoic acid transport system permease protein